MEFKDLLMIIVIIIVIILFMLVYNCSCSNERLKNLEKFNENNNMIAILVRCKDEPYVFEFVNYYINQGIDTIYIIDDNSNKEIYKDVILNNKVKIIFEKDIIQNNTVNIIYKEIRQKYEWIIYIDMDEFITTKKHLLNTIKDELLTTFKDVHCIKIPWVMMSCNSIEKNPVSLLKTNIYRWNHDLKHTNNISNEHKFRCRYYSIEVKCIFKSKYFNDIVDHFPLNPINNSINNPINDLIIVDSINNNNIDLYSHYSNLRETDILNGFLLCYHYRIISVENCLNKIKTNTWYKNYTLKDLLSSDYPEIIDKTMENKTK